MSEQQPPMMGSGFGMTLAGYTDQASGVPCVKCARPLGEERALILSCSCPCGKETPWHWSCLPHDLQVHVNAAMSRSAGRVGAN